MVFESTKEKVAFVKRNPLFSFIEDEKIHEILHLCPEKKLETGESLFIEGMPADSMFLVLSGEIQIFKNNQVLDQRTPGEYFGEYGLLDPAPRAAGARATKESVLLEINKDVFENLIFTTPEAASLIIKTIIHRTRADISNLDRGYKKLKKEQDVTSYLRRILNDSSNEIYVFSSSSLKMTQMNSRSLSKLGFEDTDYKKLTPLSFILDISEEAFRGILKPLLNCEQVTVKKSFRHKTKKGNFYPVETRFQLLVQEGEHMVIAIADDISEREAFKDELEKMAFYDELTHLYNLNGLNRVFNELKAESEKTGNNLGLLLIQINKFDELHETLGDEGVECVVLTVAGRIKSTLPDFGVLARFATHEFCVLLKNKSEKENLMALAQKILELFEKSVSAFSIDIHLTVNIGCALYPNDGHEFNLLTQHLRLALNATHKSGDNHIEYYREELKKKADEKFHLINQLKKAIDEEQFFLVFQPKVSLSSGRIKGSEALLRWNHPEMGFISPGVFIPSAEESLLIHPIGNWVIRNACRTLKNWENMGMSELKLSLNVSGVQFKEDGFIDELAVILEEEKIVPENLELELTESILMENMETVVDDLRKIKSLGVEISIDDFGTGYSSLKYLVNLPLDTLKVDKSFIDDLDHPKKSIVVESILKLGQALKFNTIAEGIELENQRDFLKALGCDLIQGYFYSKPLPLDQFNELFKKNEKEPFPI